MWIRSANLRCRVTDERTEVCLYLQHFSSLGESIAENATSVITISVSCSQKRAKAVVLLHETISLSLFSVFLSERRRMYVYVSLNEPVAVQADIKSASSQLTILPPVLCASFCQRNTRSNFQCTYTKLLLRNFFDMSRFRRVASRLFAIWCKPEVINFYF